MAASNTSGFARLTTDEAAALVSDGQLVGLSGFTASGTPKSVPLALAARAKREHVAGRPFQIRLITGASTGAVDEALAQARALSWRAPFQSSKTLREQINRGEVEFADLHLSHVPQYVEFGFSGKVNWAIVEATDVTPDGKVYLTTGIGITPSILALADKVIIEINRASPRECHRMHDIMRVPLPPERGAIPIFNVMDRSGEPFARVSPSKIAGVVESNQADEAPVFTGEGDVAEKIAAHIVAFLAEDYLQGRIPPQFLPIQAGVGNVSNAVMAALGRAGEIPPFEMYTEVMQDAQVDLLESGRITGVSTCAIATSQAASDRVFNNLDFFAPRIILRPQEISNNPGVVRRLGLIAINTVLEFDIYGNANSTHVCGTHMVNGIGGSGDFTRNAYLPILMAPSVAKNGSISAVVPMTPHVDHNEHSVQVVVTEQGLADLRGKSPGERARTIINTCAHPSYRDELHRYLERAEWKRSRRTSGDQRAETKKSIVSGPGHVPLDLDTCFDFHRRLLETGTMMP